MENSINNSSSAQSILKKVTVVREQKRSKVIYGVYDSSRQSITTRINDFLIDHSRVPVKEKSYFYQLLAVMVDAGSSVIESVATLANRTKNQRFQRVLNTIAYNLSQGRKLSEAAARFPDVFTEVEIGVIKAGEAAGNLDKMLGRLAEQMSRNHELQTKLISASIYPVVVMGLMLVAGTAMLLWVVPTLVQLLEGGGLQQEDFPVLTRLVIDLSNIIVQYWWAILFGAFFVVVAFRYFINTEDGRYRWDLFKLKVPAVGSLLQKVYVHRFISILGILIESGLPVVQALTIVATSMSNQVYKLKIFQVISRVQQGEKISSALEDTPFLFPDAVVRILAVGEQSAAIGSISTKIAKQYDTEIDYSLKGLMSLLQPLLIVIVGIMVAVLALAIILPIFRLSQAI